MSFRDARCERVDWINTEIPFSNFAHVDQFFDSDPIVRRIFSLARKHRYKSLLIERIPAQGCTLLQEESEALAEWRGDFQRCEIVRASFFRSARGDEPQPDDFLGYLIYRRDFFSAGQVRAHVYESVMTPPRRREDNNFIHGLRRYRISTTLGEFSVRGALYAQQNGENYVCAHVALRTACSLLGPHEDVSYKQLNALCDRTPASAGASGSKGLSPEQMEQILRGLSLSFDKLVNEPKHNAALPDTIEYQRELYGYLESGGPVLIGFELNSGQPGVEAERHLIPVIGHTFNDDAWVPSAQRMYFQINEGYYPSENWLSSYVIHDDNVGPYFCLPRHFLQRSNFRVMYGLKRLKADLSAVGAETLAFNQVQRVHTSIPAIGIDWYDRFAAFARCALLILRTIQIRKAQYLQHLARLSDREGNETPPDIREMLERVLPDNLWMTEITAPELFTVSRRKFGEVLLASDSDDKSPPLFIRLPGLALHEDSGDVKVHRTNPTGHTAIFQFPEDEWAEAGSN